MADETIAITIIIRRKWLLKVAYVLYKYTKSIRLVNAITRLVKFDVFIEEKLSSSFPLPKFKREDFK